MVKHQIDITINIIILITMNSAQAIYNEALGLSDIDRAALAHDLISSLNGDALKSISQEEIENKISLIHSRSSIETSGAKRPHRTTAHEKVSLQLPFVYPFRSSKLIKGFK